MPDELETFMLTQTPTPDRPLLGLTILVVEDSLYACEAMRLLCLRSGARIRRADTLKSAHRHLAVYRPMVVIIDLGLPDGSGADLIHELSIAQPRVGVILAISGDTGAQKIALAAGADGFLEKPISNLAVFQAAVLSHMPRSSRAYGPRVVNDEHISPDPLALRDDLAHISEILHGSENDSETVAYVAQFLAGLARLAQDSPLENAATNLDLSRRKGLPLTSEMSHVAALVQDRLRQGHSI